MNVENEIKKLKSMISNLNQQIEWLSKHKDALTELPDGSMYGGTLDFDHLPHTEVIKIVRKLGGKWKKSTSAHSGDKIDYKAEIDGREVRCWAGQPPPSCKVVEVEEYVPEQVIPAHTKKVLKTICKPEKNLIEAMQLKQAEAPMTAAEHNAFPQGRWTENKQQTGKETT